MRTLQKNTNLLTRDIPFFLQKSKSSDASEVRNTASYFLNDHHLSHYHKIIADMILHFYIYLKTEYQLNQ